MSHSSELQLGLRFIKVAVERDAQGTCHELALTLYKVGLQHMFKAAAKADKATKSQLTGKIREYVQRGNELKQTIEERSRSDHTEENKVIALQFAKLAVAEDDIKVCLEFFSFFFFLL